MWQLITRSGKFLLNITKIQLAHSLVPVNPHHTFTISKCLAEKMGRRRESFYETRLSDKSPEKIIGSLVKSEDDQLHLLFLFKSIP